MKKRILSVLLALVMALSLCTVALADVEVTPNDPNADANNSRNPVIGADFELSGFYYGGRVNGINAIASSSNLGKITVGEYKLKFKSNDDTDYYYADGWIGAINDDEHYYLEVEFRVNYGDYAAPAGTTLSTDKNDYKLYVCQYDTDLSVANPPYPSLGIAAESVDVNNGENVVSTATALFPLTLTVNDYSVDIPLTKNVTKRGNVAIPQADFGLEIKSASDGETGEFATFFADYIDVTDGFTYTPGTSDYSITVSGPKAVVDAYLKAGFFVHEKTHSDTHWTCDTQCWFVQDHTYHGVDSASKITSFKVDNCDTVPAFAESCNGTATVEHCYDGVTFNNVYTNSRVPSSATPTAKVEAPKTFDAGIAVYGVSALLSLTGSAWVVTRRRDR